MRWLALGLWLCALAVILGAFGAHALADRLDEAELELFETAARYLMYGGLGLSAIGIAARRGRYPGDFRVAAAAVAAGSVLFAGTVALLALGGPRWLGAVTPLGGALMIGGFALAGWKAWRA